MQLLEVKDEIGAREFIRVNVELNRNNPNYIRPLDHEINNKLLVGVLIGAAAGAAIGYLLTTDKGRELLSNLQDAAGTAGDKVRGAYDTAKNKVTEQFGRSKQYAEDLKNNV